MATPAPVEEEGHDEEGHGDAGPSPTASVGCVSHGDHWSVFSPAFFSTGSSLTLF